MKSPLLITDLSFLYDPDHFSWLGRHIRNSRVRREIRDAAAENRKVRVASAELAEQLHRYYRVSYDSIEY